MNDATLPGIDSEQAAGEAQRISLEFVAPPYLIPQQCERLTPQMLPLVQLEQRQIDAIVHTVPGGAKNVQDIYPLSPSQEGVLFHRLLSETGDAYVLSTLFQLRSRAEIGALSDALQSVLDRHDVLRSAIFWEDLPQAVQVVYRKVPLPVTELALEPGGDAVEQLKARMTPEFQERDLRRAPLCHLEVAIDAQGQCYALMQFHHLACDDRSWRIATDEVMTCLQGHARNLPPPASYRNYVAEVMAKANTKDAEAFFRSKLRDIDEPTAPFGLLDVHEDGSRTEQASLSFDHGLAQRVRVQARRLGVSAARIFHAAWGLVVARTAARDDVVYGTVLLAARRRNKATSMLGMCINPLPLRLRLRGVDAEELVRQTHRELTDLIEFRHSSLPLAQQCSGISGGAPLFTALLNYRHRTSDASRESATSERMRVIAQSGARTNYPITISVDDLGDGFVLTAQTDKSVDPARVTNYLHIAVRSMIEALEQSLTTPVLDLSILPASERRQLIESFNATAAVYPKDKTIHELFEEQVRHAPDAAAVVCEDQSLSYAELNGRANQLARYLLQQGVQSGEFIPVLMSRSVDMVIAQIAILKSGGVYVPIDPEVPIDRREFMMRDCSARRVLVAGEIVGAAGTEPLSWLDVGSVADEVRRQSADNLLLPINSIAPAYVMYTSGSTGVPKGVVVPHHAVNRLAINNGYAEIERDDCLAHYSNPMFDASTFEIWGALLNGAKVLVILPPVVLDVVQFAEMLVRQRVTVLYMSVGLFNQYAATASMFRGLRYLMVGGDSLNPEAIRRVLRDGAPQRLLNGYGPTECTTFSTTFLVETIDHEATSVPIGRPMANAQIYIMDARRRLAPLGVAGEIYIGGDGVASGYLNRRELTAERFVADPFSANGGARLYRTGDLGRWRADGAIDFLGRNDRQLKIRGFRVELGEIEAQLLRHEQVKETIVIAREDAVGEKRLVGYVVLGSAGDDVAPGAEELRERLRRVLPEYMVPSAIVILDRLPLTSTGKLDRRALPEPSAQAYSSPQYEAPRGETEQRLAGIWEELLQTERIGRHDNFFERGGHSLLATQVVARIRSQLIVEMPIRLLFDFPTLAGLSDQVDELRRSRLLGKIAAGGPEVERLLEQIASMSEGRVQEMLDEFAMEARL